jgi:biotin transporter BioY
MVAALALYIPGLLQLKAVTGADWTGTLQMGLYPFVFVDMFKALLAASGVCLTSRLFK